MSDFGSLERRVKKLEERSDSDYGCVLLGLVVLTMLVIVDLLWLDAPFGFRALLVMVSKMVVAAAAG